MRDGRPQSSRFLLSTFAAIATALSIVGPAPAADAAARACGRIVNPYPGTRYEGVDLTRITAVKLSCKTARRVARGAHRVAIGLPPSASGVRRFTWKGWRITGDLRGESDRYVAVRGDRRVRWRF
jgi:hypothetical protein